MRIRRSVLQEVAPEGRFVDIFAFVFDHPGYRRLAFDLVSRRDHDSIRHSGVLQQDRLYLLGIDIFAAGIDHVVDASAEVDIALFIGADQVARLQPAVGRDALCRDLRLLIITEGIRRAAAPQFARFTDIDFARIVFDIDDSQFHIKHRQATASQFLDAPARRQHIRARFSQPVSLHHFTIEDAFHVAHQFFGHRGGAAGQQFNRLDITAGERFPLRQHQTVHRRRAGHGGGAVAIDRFNHRQGGEAGQDGHRAANIEHRQQTAPQRIGMIKRAHDQGAVRGRVHHRADAGIGCPPLGRVAEQAAFGTTGRARGIHDHGDVIVMSRDRVEVRWRRRDHVIVGAEARRLAAHDERLLNRRRLLAYRRRLVRQVYMRDLQDRIAMRGDISQRIATQLNVHRHRDRPRAQNPEEAFDEAEVVGHENQDLVAASDASGGQHRRRPPRTRLQLRVGQRSIALFDHNLLRRQDHRAPEQLAEVI